MPKRFILEITPAGCDSPFNKYGVHTTDTSLLKSNPDSIKLMIFTGGADITPSLYGEKNGRYTYCNLERDRYETGMFELARKHKIPCVGICRGSQFICVMSGGKLVQDVTGHGGNHTMRTHTGEIITCNSTHHQMQRPNEDAIILGVAEPKLSRHYLNGDDEEIHMEQEIEAVYYPNINSLGIQWHPEWMRPGMVTYPSFLYAQQLVEEFLLKE